LLRKSTKIYYNRVRDLVTYLIQNKLEATV